MTNCPNEELPRLMAEGIGKSADGQPLTYGYRLIEAAPGLLVGVLKWEGGGFRSTRWVTLEKR